MHTQTPINGHGAAEAGPRGHVSRKRETRMRTRSMRTSRHRRTWVAAGVALLLALVLAPAAGAQQFSWYAPITLANAGGTQPADAVACPSSTQCTAVGANGQQVTFNPTNGSTTGSSAIDVLGHVSRVSCPSTSQCTAVDNLGQEVTFNPVSGATLAGGLQSIETDLSPTVPSTALNAVACPTTSFCVAVDSSGSAYRFDPTQAGSSDGGDTVDGTTALNAVACKSDASQCVAVDAAGNEITIAYPGATAAATRSTPIRSPAWPARRTSPPARRSTTTARMWPSTPPTGTGAAPSDGRRDDRPDGAVLRLGLQPVHGGRPAGQRDHLRPRRRRHVAQRGRRHAAQRCCLPGRHQHPVHGGRQPGQRDHLQPDHGTVSDARTRSSPTCWRPCRVRPPRQCTAVEAGQREFTFDPTTQNLTGQDGNGNTGRVGDRHHRQPAGERLLSQRDRNAPRSTRARSRRRSIRRPGAPTPPRPRASRPANPCSPCRARPSVSAPPWTRGVPR